MELTVEELAVYGVIDAETYIQLSDAIIAGTTTVRACFPMLDRERCERIRARAGNVLRQRWAEADDSGALATQEA
jgi:hypothetical protein